ncbi:Relaxase/Mobilization nuclease domain protein [compost metagenome]
MVARIASGKSIRGVLVYNEKKIASAEAQLLMAAGFPREGTELSFNNKLDRFEMLTRQNERTKTNTLHITLNFSREDHLDNDKLKCIASDYMEAIGFGSQPFLVYQHFDAAHPHIHIATVNIADGGQRIETHNIGKNQSEKARRMIEDRYGLIKAEDQKKEAAYTLSPIDAGAVLYGKSPTKAAISRMVREVADSYYFTTFEEFNAALRQFNVTAYRGEPGSNMFEKGGLTYHLLDGKGEKVGVPIKASAIYSSPTLRNLEKKYGPNKETRKPYGLRLKHQLEKAIKQSTDTGKLQAMLTEQDIRILLYGSKTGQIYGATFIDNATRTVYKGSSLGKEYSASAFIKRTGLSLEALTGLLAKPEDTMHNLSENRSGYTAIQMVIDKRAVPEEATIPVAEPIAKKQQLKR